MTTQSKKYSHIWDTTTVRRNPYYFNAYHPTTHDTTGSTFSLMEYSREEITVVSPRVTCKLGSPRVVKCAVKPKRVEKPRDVYVSNWEREQAEPPKQLGTWKFSPIRKEKYNPHAVSDAFEAYQHRLAVKKWAEPKHATKTHTHTTRTTHKKHVTINETATQIVEDKCPKYQKQRLTNRRNDEIKIDKLTTTTRTVTDDVEGDDVEDDDVIIKMQKTTQSSTQKPGFYGTIEAEMCAEQAADHLAYACDNLERLRFVTDAVYPQTTHHLKRLHEIDEDVKDFASQMRKHRVKVPVSAGTATQIAHFIINEN